MRYRKIIMVLVGLLAVGFALNTTAGAFQHRNGASNRFNDTAGHANPPMILENPQPVAGPHPVSQEEWTRIIRSLQPRLNRPNRIPDTPPRPFDFIPGIDTTKLQRRSDAKS